MQLRRRVIMTSIVFVIISLLLTFTLVMLSDYRYNDVTYIGDEELKTQVIDDISIEGDYFLLTPTLLVDYRLNKLEYIKNASVKKVIPNQITITYEVNSPSFCDESKIYFEDSTVPLTENNHNKCIGIPQIIDVNKFTEFDEFVKAYEELSITFREHVVFVEQVDNYYQFTMNSDLVIMVYLTQFDNLNNYEQYQVVNNTLDLRPKYS